MEEVIELLLKQGLVSAAQIEKARDETKRTGIKLEKALERLGFIAEEDIAKVRADALGVLYMNLSDYLIDAELIKLIPEPLAKKYKTVPLFKISSTLTVAMTDPRNIEALDQVRKSSNMDAVDIVLVSEKSIQKVLDAYYGAAGSVEEIIKGLEKEKFDGKTQELDAGVEPPVIKLVNIMIMEAAKSHTSDIHIEPEPDTVRVRYRIDGVLHEEHILPKKLQNAVTSRIKILANMDISENRRPQDGKIRLRLESRDLDIRVSTFPTVYGENVVMRLLDKSSILVSLKELGFSQNNLDEFEKLAHRPDGIILVTGPTGSGKSTTLYATLAAISTMEKNIITIEDPVEYELPLIRQTQVNPKADITFANGLRSILRQDPDVIMVGEIRDRETAEVAIQAALTGHLVLSTLHTNDAASTLMRLVDMGVEPFLVSSSLVGIVAQRLVRKICPKCSEAYLPQDSVVEELGLERKVEFYRGKGCSSCHNTGLQGRIAIFELLVINEEIRGMINAKKSVDEVKKKVLSLGMKTLREDGINKAREGLTTLEEVMRVTEAF